MRIHARAPPPTRGWTRVALAPGGRELGSPAYAGMDPYIGDCAEWARRLPRLRGDGPAPPENRGSASQAPPPTRGWTRLDSLLAAGSEGSPAYAGMDPAARAGSRARPGLPRLRGDGPEEPLGEAACAVAPPPTRGWTRGPLALARPRRGSPAYAGMDPFAPRSGSSPAGLPRLRGDGPVFDRTRAPTLPAPPPTRGWTRGARHRRDRQPGSPAYAGMDLYRVRVSRARDRLPRLRGDGPMERVRPGDGPVAPPPTRGWTRGRRRRGRPPAGSPAYAGMDPFARSRSGRGAGLPRLRGDGPEVKVDEAMLDGAPPPTRGWTLGSFPSAAASSGSPAYAGMDPGSGSPPPRSSRLPRLRGDGPGTPRHLASSSWAPPPTRGWTPRPLSGRLAGDGSPAYAGMDLVGGASVRQVQRLPRLRGDGPAKEQRRRRKWVAPPPTRGWTREDDARVPDGVGSPAYAGMDPSKTVGQLTEIRLPRLRGDGPQVKTEGLDSVMAPPPTRGWTRVPAQHPGPVEGSPAYAGMDPSPTSNGGSGARLPRLRGDGPRCPTRRRGGGQAPPPTRGWTSIQRRASGRRRGSPAYAGMDPW